MSTGKIVVALSSNQQAQPIRNASIVISDSITNRVVARLSLENSQTGVSPAVTVDAPSPELSQYPELRITPYSVYNVAISAPGYYDATVRGVQVLPDETAVLEADLIALPLGTQSGSGVVDIPVHNLFSPIPPSENRQDYDNTPYVLGSVVIPQYITVHLGRPNQSARNVTVRFVDYIKNVACSEIYATWPVEAIKANVYAQISLALNRIYTEWYRSRGYSFDITNSTAYDQYFVYGRNIFENISDIVDGLFNTYVRKVGTRNPYYTEYCDGQIANCPGMKQWGTVTLANNGYSALQILQYYYGTDIELAKAEQVAGVTGSYPGSPLSVGSTGANVTTVQRQLARVAQNYPAIGNVPVDGVYSQRTAEAVRTFQQIFNLTADGVVGESTWYKLSYIYVAVTKLAELSGEGERYDTGEGAYPGFVLRIGSSGSAVSSLQYYLQVIANSISYIPTVSIDGIFGTATEYAVRQFQSLNGLVVDGAVGQTTWNAIYNAYKGIVNNYSSTAGSSYPGTPLTVGSSGQDVSLMQGYLNDIAALYSSIPGLTVDGIFGQNTRLSVIEFQRLFGLTADGIIGENTWNAITDVRSTVRENAYGGTALRNGSTGAQVRKLQELLNFVGRTYTSIPALTEDGVFGSGTEAAVRQFQRLFGLAADGVAGSATWNELLRVYTVLMYNPSSSDGNVYPGTPLSIGSSGDAVARMQSYINYIARIYPTVPTLTVDGIYGENTARAVRILQGLFGYVQDGVIGEDTWNLIVSLYGGLSRDEYPGAALYEGSEGSDVRTVQEYLNFIAKTYPSIPQITVDGVFGPGTRNAVVAFQRQFSLNPDGIVGRNTWNALLENAYLLLYSRDRRDRDEYPGSPLSVGSTGQDVEYMQERLNFIGRLFGEIPAVSVNGVYGNTTRNAVSAFQQLFLDSSDGVIGEETWNKIVKVYNDMNERQYGGTLLRVGSTGAEVLSLQQMLSTVASVYPDVPDLAKDGIFGSGTRNSVLAFQRKFSLSPDGIVGPLTWNRLLREYLLIMDSQTPPTGSDVYPGTPLSLGSRGESVLQMQQYLNKIQPYYSALYRLPENALFDSAMQVDVRNFQQLFGITADGVIGPATWDKIVSVKNGVSADAYGGTLLRRGSRGSEVRKLQERLNGVRSLYSSIPLLSPDGIFGSETERAVRLYQSQKGIRVDGIVGTDTWNRLIGDYYVING